MRSCSAEMDMKMKSSVLRDGDVERTAGDVLVPPFDDEDVAALFFDGVGDIVHPVAHVFDVHLLAGRLWPVNANHQHVGACGVNNKDMSEGENDPFTNPSCPCVCSSPALLQSTVKVFF